MTGRNRDSLTSLYERLRSAYEAQGCAWESLPEEFRRLVCELGRAHEAVQSQSEAGDNSWAHFQDQGSSGRALFEATPVAYLLVDRYGLIHDANGAALRLLGTERPHLCGQPLTAFIVAEDHAGFQGFWEGLTAEAAEREHEVRLKHRTGMLVHVLVGAGVLGRAAGQSERILVTLADVTRLRQTERDLRLAQAELAERNERLAVELDLTNRRLRSEVRQHREVARALHTTEEQYGLLVENATEGIVVAQDFQIRFANRAVCEIVGKPLEQLRGEPMLQFLHPDDRPMVIERHHSRMEGRAEVDTYHLRLFDRNNQIRWYQASVVSIEWEERPAALLFLKEITQRVAVEERLERERELLHTILDNIPVMITCYDAEGTLLLWNRALEKTLGWTEADLRARPVMELCYPDPAYRREVWEFMTTCLGQWRDVETVAKDGSCVMTAWTNVRLADGRQIGIGIDIRERLELVRQVENERGMLTTILDNIPVIITVYDEAARVLYANPAYERILGWTKEDFATADALELLLPDAQERQEGLEFMMTYPDRWRDFNTHGKSGAVVPTSWRNVYLADGKMIGIGIDVRERKEWEERLERERKVLQAILDSIPVMISIYDLNGKSLMLNPAYEKTLGWTVEDLADGRGMEKMFPDPAYREGVWRFITTQHGQWGDFDARAKSGEVVRSSWYNVTLWDELQIGIGIDIRDRVRAEKELREAFAQLERKHTALNEVIAQVEARQQEVKTIVALNIEKALRPVLRRLKRQTRDRRLLLNIELAEQELENIASPLLNKIEARFSDLTKREQEVALLLGKGYRTEDAAAALGLSLPTAQKYRELIRRKLRLTGRKINLNAYLKRFVEGE